MNVYAAFNLCIHSEIALNELVVGDGAADVTIRRGNLSHIDKATLDYGNRVMGRLAGIGAFLIEDGQFITVEPEGEPDDTLLSPTILGPVMSLLLRQRGLLVLHASSVAINHKAVAFMGGSGWGKSTLARAFQHEGYNVLTDDVLAVQTHDDMPIVIPAFPQMKLWGDAANSLGHETGSLPPIFSNSPKLSYKFTTGFQNAALPLQRIYVLSKGSEHQITDLQPQAAFAELVRHSREVNLLKSPDFVKSHLEQCAAIVKQVPCSRFTRKSSLTDLPQLVNMVKEDLEKATSQTSSDQISSNQTRLASPASLQVS